MRFILSFTLILWGFLLRGQDSLPVDWEATQLLQFGKQYLEVGNYPLAIEAFQSASFRPEHQASSAAIYLLGLAYFRAGMYEEAHQNFSGFLAQHPRSRYAAEALYHRARIALGHPHPPVRRRGVQDLLALYDTTRQASLAQDIEAVLQRHLFFVETEAEIDWLWHRAPLRADRLFVEAWVYRRMREGRRFEAQDAYRRYRERGGEVSLFAERLLALEQTVKYVEPGICRIALALPLFLSDSLPDSLAQMPVRHRPAIEFYEGFMLAIETQSPLIQKQVYVEVLDTWRDSARLAWQLGRLDALQPDVVVGEIYNDRSAQLAEWAERTATPQMVPLSPSASLADGRSYVFLAHPSAAGHGQAMGAFAWDSLGLQRVAVCSDQRRGTEQLAEAFSATFDLKGGEVLRLQVDSVYNDSTRDQIFELVRSLRAQRVDGVYIPILNNQEIAGLILSQMRLMDIEVAVMGGPHWWHRYENVDRDLKNSYQLLFSTGYMTAQKDPELANFEREYLRIYRLPPSNYAVQGYDIGMYLLQVLDNYDYRQGLSLASYLRMYPVFQGIHINFDFQGSQINRFVNIGAYKEGQIKKINGGKRTMLPDLFSPVPDR
ncbi:MAG: outer membrane protein assembly factor BamD [Bacteroidetes bacterium]|nr:MAG: outer membrane protein assembly factor BamD [Bacteroidota bacterium]